MRLRNTAAATGAVTGENGQDNEADGAGNDAYLRADAHFFFGVCLLDGRCHEAAPRPDARAKQHDAGVAVHAAHGLRPGKHYSASSADQGSQDYWMSGGPPSLRRVRGLWTVRGTLRQQWRVAKHRGMDRRFQRWFGQSAATFNHAEWHAGLGKRRASGGDECRREKDCRGVAGAPVWSRSSGWIAHVALLDL
jgi:hypothetical protein